MDFGDIVIYLSIYIGLVATIFYLLVFIKGSRSKKELYTDKELPSVSIIIPAYNEEKTIANTIKSVSESNYPFGKLEIIVIDDGSKDGTFKIAKKLENKNIRVFSKKNGGKAAAINFALKKANGEIVFTMDADTIIEKHSIREMCRYFKNKNVMAVTPSIVLHNPKTIWEKIQHLEYLLGIFLRKSFSTINAIHVTPGAFSAYRKSFFDKYGGYQVGNITEDLEVSLRIQSLGYIIESCPEAPAYTIGPNSFRSLLIQRRRWYTGLISNTWRYRKIFSPKYGDMGIFVLPVAWTSIFFAIYMVIKTIFKTIDKVIVDLNYWASINYDIYSDIDLSFLALKKAFIYLFSNPISIFLMLFVVLLIFYLYYASRKIGQKRYLGSSLVLFFLFFAFLFGFWWIVAYIYSIFNKKVNWR